MDLPMNRIAVSILIILIFVLPLSLYWSQSASSQETQIRLTGRMADAGGWSRDGIVVEAGEQIIFQLSSEDVMHGFAIGLVDPSTTWGVYLLLHTLVRS
jgi:heme/copper-type cytochrome/quinol oxidase subunit 2